MRKGCVPICIASCLMDYEIRIYFLCMENIIGKRFLYYMYEWRITKTNLKLIGILLT